jgi:hypothetical protein
MGPEHAEREALRGPDHHPAARARQRVPTPTSRTLTVRLDPPGEVETTSSAPVVPGRVLAGEAVNGAGLACPSGG